MVTFGNSLVRNKLLQIFLVIAAAISAVPSAGALHPLRHVKGSHDDDITGVRDAGSEDRAGPKAVKRDKGQDPSMAERWRHMARQARRLAKAIADKPAQQKLLDLAEGYEELAKTAEQNEST